MARNRERCVPSYEIKEIAFEVLLDGGALTYSIDNFLVPTAAPYGAVRCVITNGSKEVWVEATPASVDWRKDSDCDNHNFKYSGPIKLVANI